LSTNLGSRAAGIVRKFMFDESFDADGGMERLPAAGPQPDGPGGSAPRYGEAELAAARSEGFAAGRAEAAAQARASIDQAIAGSEAAIAQGLDGLLGAQQRAADDLQRSAVRAATAMVRKLFPALSRREGLGEIEAVVASVLEGLREEPRLVVRVSDDLLDPLKARLDALSQATGFAGRLVLLADEAVRTGDCRVEWADGGIERDCERLLRHIDAAALRVLATAVPAEASNTVGSTPAGAANVEENQR